MAENFELGETYFTAAGEKVYLDAITTDGKFVVSQIMRFEDHYDSFYEDVGPSKLVDKIFQAAPVAVIDERFIAAQTKLSDIENQYQARFAEIVKAERQIKDRLAKLKKYEGLDRLEDFIDGNITHLVLVDEDYKIVGLERLDEMEYGRKRGMKLVTLFGASGGDLVWRVNQYSDGSGSGSWEIIPCASEEEAVAKRAERILRDVQDSFAAFAPDRPYWLLRRVEKAIEFDITVPDSIMARYKECKKLELATAEANARKAVADAQAKLDEFLAKGGAA
ncbi:hypothetical protein [Neorhizobium sp. T6_25]|uniref:hypothetical protein n=1 Tax=Neorhizobium sp. T6_25 TaxID=2093833 RepID=UPI000CF8DFCC|nr:hypothetical protein [Neorhizobium sp. T6_25]